MDRKYIEAEHIVDRYLSGDLTVREAREFEQYCHDHPEALKAMPIPVRLKTRLSRRPARTARRACSRRFPPARPTLRWKLPTKASTSRKSSASTRAGRASVATARCSSALAFALVAAVAGVIAYAVQANSLSKQIKDMERAAQCDANAGGGKHAGLSRAAGAAASRRQPTLALGWMQPPQWLDLYIDVSEGKYNQFMIRIEKVDERARHAAAARGARFQPRAAPGAQLVRVRTRAITCSRSTATTGAGRRKKSAGYESACSDSC